MSPAERPGGDRRNLTGKELAQVIAIVDLAKRKAKGGNNPYGRSGKPEEEIEKPSGFSISKNTGVETRYEVAELVGTSPTTVTRARVVSDDPGAMAESTWRGSQSRRDQPVHGCGGQNFK